MSARSWVAVTALVGLTASVGLFFGARQSAPRIALQELRARYGTVESKYTTVAGMRIHYRDEGQGPVVVLLHGSFGNLHTFDGVVAALHTRYRFIRYDQVHSGLSDPVPANLQMTPELFLQQFLDSIGVRSAAFVGTSSGGIIAYRFAATYPERTNALILANVPPSAPVDNAGAQARVPWRLRQSIAVCLRYSRPWSRTCFRDFLNSTVHRPGIVTAALVEQYYDLNRRPDAGTMSSLAAIMRKDEQVLTFLAQVKAPTLLIWGALDHVLQPPTADLLIQRLTATRAQKLLLADVSHYPPLEAPLEVAADIDHFLQPPLP